MNNKTSKNLWRITAGQRVRYAAAIAVTGLASAFMLTVPLVGGYVLDVVDTQDLSRGPEALVNAAHALAAFWGWQPYVAYLVVSGVAGVGLTALGASCQYLQGRWAAIASEALARRLRETMYARLQHLPASFFDEADTGDLVQRCSSDVETVRVFLSSQVVQIGRSVLLLSVLTPILFVRDARLAGLALVLMPFIITGAYYFFAKVRAQFKITDESEGALTARLQENLTGIRVVRAFARQDYEVSHFGAKSITLRDNRERLNRLSGAYWAVSDFLCTAQVCIVLIAGGIFLAGGTLTVGELFAFMMQVTMVIWPVRHLGQVLNESGKAMVSLGRINHVLQADEESREPAPTVERARGELVLEDVCVEYEPGKPVLDGLSVHIPAGETVGIVGPPGAGKSTLIRVLARLYEPQRGRILIDGLDIRDVDRHWLRRQFGIVMQNPFLYSRTVADNLRLARSDVNDDEMVAAAREAAVHDAIAGFPAGYRSRVGERGVTLSGGQRQRLALARALLVEPPILVLDDALSAVDTGTEREIMSALDRRRGRHTTIIIAHRLSSVRNADRILVLERGHLIQEGTHATLAATSGPYRRLCEIQGALDQAIEQDLKEATDAV
ncbi:MAG: ABC transporter ATP-binding protein [Gammaproteobacteria bacterium]|nr:ABC transporter ATP-binding protein [Gammaproteobacteria bacterium]MXY55710.1 ABC transporter ATP-binding protein [Gammaproteobacteria bacterium]MYF30768.1 ABC transporter ATP-binding protein [Gammaproteobacteria bacterium]MYK48508.1 ABC transporter ATP-binding protein [Gammaproteobacteria bacterium]